MGISMEQPFSETIEQAEAAIRNADDKRVEFKPLLEGLGVDSVVGNTTLFDGQSRSPIRIKNSQQALDDERERRDQISDSLHCSKSNCSQHKSQRYKRPMLMRGIVI